jgi:transposase
VCLEATDTWATGVALALHAAGHRVSLVNPAQFHAFGRSGLKRIKSDKADALLIARFCQMHQPPTWTPLLPRLQQLQGLLRRLEHLDETRTMEKNRLTSGGVCGPVEKSLKEHISYLEEQMEKHGTRSKNTLMMILN